MKHSWPVGTNSVAVYYRKREIVGQKFTINSNIDLRLMTNIGVSYRSKIHNQWQYKSKLMLLV